MPLRKDVHIDKALSNISLKYGNEAYISQMLCPNVPVKHETDKYYIYGREHFQLPEARRSQGAPANQIDYNVTNAAYQLYKYSLKKLVTDDEKNNADQALRPEIDATEYLTDLIMLRREYEAAKTINTTTAWNASTSLAAANQFSANTTVSNPMPYFHTAAATLVKQSGKHPNVASFSYAVFNALVDHVSVVERVKYTSDVVTEKILSSLFNCGKVLVGKAIYNSAKEGATESMAEVWGDDSFIAYVEPSPGLMKASALYCLTQQAYGNPYKVKKWYDDDLEGTFVEVTTKFTHKVVSNLCGYLIKDCLA